MKRPIFLNNHFYHIFNRGVEKRNIFLEAKDYHRFLCDMDDFNDTNSSINLYRRVNMGYPISHKADLKERLVEVVHYCLMPNHFHLILKQAIKGGVSKFIQKLGIGFTNYFNLKYARSGVLFQGKFKAILIDKENYMDYLIQYIDLNPLDLIEPKWKEVGLKNWPKAKQFLKSYRWASCKNYNQYDEIFSKQKIVDFDRINDFVLE